MEKDINIHYLKVLTELQLYPELEGLKTDPRIKGRDEINKKRSEIIDDFIENLPDYLRNIENSKEIIDATLKKVDKNISKMKKMDRQEER